MSALSIFYSMLTKLFFSHFFCTEKPFTKNISITSFSQYTTICFVSFVYSVFNEHLRRMKFAMVGPSGLEPPTSCLSGTRSNLLSYEPMWLVWILFTPRILPVCWKFLCLPFFSMKVSGGDDGIRTHDPLLAGQVLSQLSYTPI